MFKKSYELSKLIIERKEFTEWENDYWISLLPSMTESQQERLYNILYEEKIELEKLDKQFAKKRVNESLSFDFTLQCDEGKKEE